MPSGSDPIVGGAGLGAPGQRVTRQETTHSEVWLPIQQCIVATCASWFIYAMLLVSAIIAGPIAVIIVGYVVPIGCALYAAGKTRTNTERWIVAVLIASAIVAWTLYGADVAGGMYSRFPARLVLIGGCLIAAANAVPLVWRMQAEIQNPNWSPPLNPRNVGNGGVGWMFTKYRDPDAPPEPEPPQEPRRVLRGVPVTEHGRTRVIALPEAADVDQDDLVEAPSGAHVPADDLRAYVAQAPVTGTSYRVWADRDKWSHEQWRDVVATLARLGILEEPQARHPTAFAVGPEEATRVLEEFLGNGND